MIEGLATLRDHVTGCQLLALLRHHPPATALPISTDVLSRHCRDGDRQSMGEVRETIFVFRTAWDLIRDENPLNENVSIGETASVPCDETKEGPLLLCSL